jgi:hypothetical protein
MFKLVNVFYFNKLDVSKLNLTSVCLISKKADANLLTNLGLILIIVLKLLLYY